MRAYLDSSVILDLVFKKGARAFPPDFAMAEKFTSRLSQVEVLRSTTKVAPELLNTAAEILSQLNFVELDISIINQASVYPASITLKSSDAIHMATAEMVLDSDDLLLTYDKQMALNAERLGIRVASELL